MTAVKQTALGSRIAAWAGPLAACAFWISPVVVVVLLFWPWLLPWPE